MEVYDDAMMGTHGGDPAAGRGQRRSTPTWPRRSPSPRETRWGHGAVLGTVGDTAIAESGMESHLHLEMMVNEEYVDPLTYLPEQN